MGTWHNMANNNLTDEQKRLGKLFANANPTPPPEADPNAPGMFSRIMGAISPSQASADTPPPAPTPKPLDEEATNFFNKFRR